jgi:lysophospholipase L1-like esterase
VAFQRFVAIGDSFTEGVGDPDPYRPNGWRGWADRVAEVLATKTDDFGYANLAIRGRKLDAIVDEQLEAALALNPDLLSIQGAGNDLLRPSVDIDRLVGRLDEAAERAMASGATVMLYTHGDGGSNGVFGAIRGRVAIFNELLREVAERHGTVLVDNWRIRGGSDPRYWHADRLHLGPAGHQGVAMHVLDALGIEHDLQPLELPELVQKSAWERRRANAEWARTHAAPWIGRRLTGRSSGDGVSPKRPELAPITP